MSRRLDPNRELLLKVAIRLGAYRSDFVFVGGTTVGILLSDPAASAPRPTVAVDLLVNAKNLAEYQSRIRNQLIELGLKESVEPGDPICAWRLDGLRVDVMP